MSRYDEDKSDRMINSNKLNSLFGSSGAVDNQEINNTISESEEITESLEEQDNPDDIIYRNIERANRFLDQIENNLASGLNARLFEVAAGLIATVTQAATSIVGNTKNMEIEYKQRILDLKEREIAVKEALGSKGGGKTINNMIVTDRESLLKMIKGEEPKETSSQYDNDENEQ